MKLYSYQKKVLNNLFLKTQEKIKGKHIDEIKNIWLKYREKKKEKLTHYKEVNTEKRLIQKGTKNIEKLTVELDKLKTEYKKSIKGLNKYERAKKREKYHKKKSSLTKKFKKNSLQKALESKSKKEIEKGFDNLIPYSKTSINDGREEFYLLPHKPHLLENSEIVNSFISYLANKKLTDEKVRYIVLIITYRDNTLDMNATLSDVMTVDAIEIFNNRGEDIFLKMVYKERLKQSDFLIDAVKRIDIRVIYENIKAR